MNNGIHLFLSTLLMQNKLVSFSSAVVVIICRRVLDILIILLVADVGTKFTEMSSQLIIDLYEIPTVCYDYKLQQKVSHFVQQVKLLSPNISAADFFVVDRRMVCNFIGAFASYLIVVMQLGPELSKYLEY
ncbi:uncharacterized protein LOC142329483 [Lycorma delicatula]|uniref:uncharacterized protein LOC142329483 n=1 Tax=Lycorma delicatula TaxID=130591 RepID=UPI003F5163A3